MGIVVKRSSPVEGPVMALLLIGCKCPSGSLVEVESHVLDAAVRCIVRDNLPWIYGITTVGVSFRTWFVTENHRQLIPAHGMAISGDRTQYFDADSEKAWIFNETITLAKTQRPLRLAPTVPSQPTAERDGRTS